MLDRKIEKHYHQYGDLTREVVVNQHRAPTDDSIRLAEEYREKALKSIISDTYENNNTFSYRVIVLDKNYLAGMASIVCVIIVIINNKRYDIEADVTNLVHRTIIKKETLDGPMYEYDIDSYELNIIKMKLLASLILKAMLDFSQEEFDKLKDAIIKSNGFI